MNERKKCRRNNGLAYTISVCVFVVVGYYYYLFWYHQKIGLHALRNFAFFRIDRFLLANCGKLYRCDSKANFWIKSPWKVYKIYIYISHGERLAMKKKRLHKFNKKWRTPSFVSRSTREELPFVCISISVVLCVFFYFLASVSVIAYPSSFGQKWTGTNVFWSRHGFSDREISFYFGNGLRAEALIYRFSVVLFMFLI